MTTTATSSTGLSTPTAPTTSTSKVGEHLGEAREHLRQAGRGAIDTLSSAADQAREQYRGHRDDIRSEIREAGTSLQAAAGEARIAAREQWDHAVDYSKQLGDRGTVWVRENPLKALGLAVLGGIVLSKLLSRGR
jgi:ElaB/YqjD/DUF883 family membrane-anchored ribosome-binding protein